MEEENKVEFLKDNGIVSEEDFDAQKQIILLKKEIAENAKYSQKSGIVFGLLGFFLGFTGAHNFYLEKDKKGNFQLIIFLLACCICPIIPIFTIGLLFDGLNPIQITRLVVFTIIFIYLVWIALDLTTTQKDGEDRLIKQRKIPVVLGILMLLLSLVFFFNLFLISVYVNF